MAAARSFAGRRRSYAGHRVLLGCLSELIMRSSMGVLGI